MKTEQTSSSAKPRKRRMNYPSIYVDAVEAELKGKEAGLTAYQLALLVGISWRCARTALTELVAAGRCIFVCRISGDSVFWHPEFEASRAEYMRERSRLRRVRSVVRRKEVRNAPQNLGDFERDSVHRLVSASTAVRLRPAGPASVWDLAA